MVSLPDEDIIATYDANTGNIKITSNVKLLDGDMTRVQEGGALAVFADAGVILPNLTETERDAIASPKDGAVIFNTTDDEINFYSGGQWNGSTYGCMYQVNNAVVTTINTVDVFEDIINFVAGEVKEVTFASSTLTTPSDETRTYQISYSVCLDGNTNTTFETAIEIDGVVRDESHSCATIATGGRDVGLSGNFILTIGASKDIKLVVANKTNTQDVTVVDASVSIVGIR